MSTSAPQPESRARKAHVSTSAAASAVEFTEDMMQAFLTDGRILSVPLIWFPSLQAASPEQRARYRISAGGRGPHWPDLDEDLSLAGLMAGVEQQSA